MTKQTLKRAMEIAGSIEVAAARLHELELHDAHNLSRGVSLYNLLGREIEIREDEVDAAAILKAAQDMYRARIADLQGELDAL